MMTIQEAISCLEGVLCGAELLETDVDDITDLLREQEPHLLTIEDFVRADHYGYLAAWTEEKNGDQFWKIITIRALERDKKRMRYWSSRPTNKQREAVKWDEAD